MLMLTGHYNLCARAYTHALVTPLVYIHTGNAFNLCNVIKFPGKGMMHTSYTKYNTQVIKLL